MTTSVICNCHLTSKAIVKHLRKKTNFNVPEKDRKHRPKNIESIKNRIEKDQNIETCRPNMLLKALTIFLGLTVLIVLVQSQGKNLFIYFFKGWPQLELYFNQMHRTEHT